MVSTDEKRGGLFIEERRELVVKEAVVEEESVEMEKIEGVDESVVFKESLGAVSGTEAIGGACGEAGLAVVREGGGAGGDTCVAIGSNPSLSTGGDCPVTVRVC